MSKSIRTTTCTIDDLFQWYVTDNGSNWRSIDANAHKKFFKDMFPNLMCDGRSVVDIPLDIVDVWQKLLYTYLSDNRFSTVTVIERETDNAHLNNEHMFIVNGVVFTLESTFSFYEAQMKKLEHA